MPDETPSAPPDQEARRLGVLVADWLRSVLMPSSMLLHLAAAGRDILGKEMEAVFYLAGERMGREIGDFNRARSRGLNTAQVLERIRRNVQLRGFGELELVSFNPESGRAIMQIRYSPFLDLDNASSPRACGFPAGFLAGLVGALIGKPVVAEETRCAGVTKGHCEFESRIA